jgi:AcrR family transcriptional regulator
MPYSAEHKEATRERIVECARRLFNHRGFSDVSIDDVMAEAGLTRGGFYNHFSSKDDLFVEAVLSYGSRDPTENWDDIELDFTSRGLELAKQVIDAYLSRRHLEDLDNQCPMIAVPSDVARAGPRVRAAYAQLLEGMAAMFEGSRSGPVTDADRKRALRLITVCVGGMILARTLADPALADEIREAAHEMALELAQRGTEALET